MGLELGYVAHEQAPHKKVAPGGHGWSLIRSFSLICFPSASRNSKPSGPCWEVPISGRFGRREMRRSLLKTSGPMSWSSPISGKLWSITGSLLSREPNTKIERTLAQRRKLLMGFDRSWLARNVFGRRLGDWVLWRQRLPSRGIILHTLATV